MMLFSNPVYYLLAYARCNGIKYQIKYHRLTIYHVFDPNSEIFKIARHGLYDALYMDGRKYEPYSSRTVYGYKGVTVIDLPSSDIMWDDILYSEKKRDNHTWICGVQASPYYDTAGGLVVNKLVTEEELMDILDREGKPVCKEVEPGIYYCGYAYVNMIHKGNCEGVAVIPYSQYSLAKSLKPPVYVVPDPSLFCKQSYPPQLSTNEFLQLLELIWDNFSGGGIPVKFVEGAGLIRCGARRLFDNYFVVYYDKSCILGELISNVMYDVDTALRHILTPKVKSYIDDTAKALNIRVSAFTTEQMRTLKDALLEAMSRNVYYLRIPLCKKYEYSSYKLVCSES